MNIVRLIQTPVRQLADGGLDFKDGYTKEQRGDVKREIVANLITQKSRIGWHYTKI